MYGTSLEERGCDPDDTYHLRLPAGMIGGLSLIWLLTVFAVAAAVAVAASVRATALADIIADRTRLGEAMVGGLLLGGATSLAGVVVSVSAASGGDASFAVSNAVGGIAAQTLFLAFADTLHKNANLEHAAAEPANLFQAVMLLILLSLPIAAIAGPDIAYFGVHPVSLKRRAEPRAHRSVCHSEPPSRFLYRRGLPRFVLRNVVVPIRDKRRDHPDRLCAGVAADRRRGHLGHPVDAARSTQNCTSSMVPSS